MARGRKPTFEETLTKLENDLQALKEKKAKYDKENLEKQSEIQKQITALVEEHTNEQVKLVLAALSRNESCTLQDVIKFIDTKK